MPATSAFLVAMSGHVLYIPGHDMPSSVTGMGRVWRFPVTERKRLTDAIVRRLPLPQQGKAITIDADVPGFGARVTANAHRRFILRYTTRAGRERTFTIGDASVWRTTEARDRARELRREIEDGGDPLGDIQDERAAPTMLDLIERFRSEHLPKKRPRTALEYGYLLQLHIEPHFGQHAKVADVRFEDIDALHRKITKSGSPYAANRTIALLSKMFALAIKWRMRETNPVKGIERNREYRAHQVGSRNLARCSRPARHARRSLSAPTSARPRRCARRARAALSPPLLPSGFLRSPFCVSTGRRSQLRCP
jgi:hypothetical protein